MTSRSKVATSLSPIILCSAPHSILSTKQAIHQHVKQPQSLPAITSHITMPLQPATPALPTTGADPPKMPDLILRNIRGKAVFAALNEVFATKVMNNGRKRIEMAKHFWGDEEYNTGICVRKLLNGREAFATLFDLVSMPTGYDLYLRDHFAGGHGRWAVGKLFNEELLVAAHSKKTSQLA